MCSWQHWMLSQEKNDFHEWMDHHIRGRNLLLRESPFNHRVKNREWWTATAFRWHTCVFLLVQLYSCSSKSATWVQWHLFSLQTIAEHTSRQDKNSKAQFPMQMSLVMLLWELLVCRKHFYPLIFWIKKNPMKTIFFLTWLWSRVHG